MIRLNVMRTTAEEASVIKADKPRLKISSMEFNFTLILVKLKLLLLLIK